MKNNHFFNISVNLDEKIISGIQSAAENRQIELEIVLCQSYFFVLCAHLQYKSDFDKCLYVKDRVGGIREFMASVPLGTGAFCF